MDTGMFGLAKYTALKKDTPPLYTIEAVLEMIKKGEVKIEGYTLIKDSDIKNMINDIEKAKPKRTKSKAKTIEEEKIGEV